MRVKPAPQHALEQVLGHVFNGTLAQGPRHQGISQLVEDKILRQQIGEAGKQTVINSYSSTAWEDKYLKLFKAVTTKD